MFIETRRPPLSSSGATLTVTCILLSWLFFALGLGFFAGLVCRLAAYGWALAWQVF